MSVTLTDETYKYLVHTILLQEETITSLQKTNQILSSIILDLTNPSRISNKECDLNG